MIFDTDVLIWILRRNPRAIRLGDVTEDRHVSVVSYLELIYGARDRVELRKIQNLLANNDFETLALTENIGRRAAVYMEEYSLQVRLDPADALIAATAVENGLPLATGNSRHFRAIQELEIVLFRPR